MHEITYNVNFSAKSLNSVEFKQILTSKEKSIRRGCWDCPVSKFLLVLKMLTERYIAYQDGSDQFV